MLSAVAAVAVVLNQIASKAPARKLKTIANARMSMPAKIPVLVNRIIVAFLAMPVIINYLTGQTTATNHELGRL